MALSSGIAARAVQRFVLCVVALAMGASAFGGEGADAPIRKLSDLDGKRLGVIAGTMLDQAANATLDYTHILYFDNSEQMLPALLAGEIDAIVDDEPVVRYLANRDPRLRRLPEAMQDDYYAYGIRQDDVALRNDISAAIIACKEDGTLADLVARWVDGTDEQRVMPDLPRHPETAPVLRLGSSPISAPFAYANEENGPVIGLDIELMERVAYRLGRRLTVASMEFSNLIPSLLDDRVDVISSCLSVTEERSQIISFTESYYKGGVSVLVLDRPGGE